MVRFSNGALDTFAVDTKNQLSSTPLSSASYDANGNLTSYTSHYGSGSLARTCTYDNENRLTSVLGTAVYRSDFAYDGLGRARTRIDYTWTGSTW
jgi:YD repeat-containing protein